MKKPILFLAALTLSSVVFAGNMHENNSGTPMEGDMISTHGKMKSAHNSMSKDIEKTEILKNKDMQRLHKEMTLYGLSEVGMEARRKMISDKGRAYHRALEKRENNISR